jgi:protein-disulfide isomerase
MDDLNKKKNSLNPILIVVLLLVLIGLGAYAYMKGNSTSVPLPEDQAQTVGETAQPGQTADMPTDATQLDTDATPSVVVETKKLEVPAADAQPETPASIADPAIAEMMAPRFVGAEDAPVTITEYASLTCPHCASFHKENYAALKEKFIDTGRVKMAFVEFPLNKPALEASQILRCMPKDKYVGFMNLLFTEQEKWAFDDNYRDALRQNAKLAGMTDDAFDNCLANTKLQEAILAEMQRAGEKYKVASTPSFVIDEGREVLVGNQPVEMFEKAIVAVGSTGQAPAAGATAPATGDVGKEAANEAAADAAASAAVPPISNPAVAPPAE